MRQKDHITDPRKREMRHGCTAVALQGDKVSSLGGTDRVPALKKQPLWASGWQGILSARARNWQVVENWRMPVQTRLEGSQILEGEFRITEQNTGRATGQAGRRGRRESPLFEANIVPVGCRSPGETEEMVYKSLGTSGTGEVPDME